MRLEAAGGAVAGVLMVGGVGGGFDSPARGLYERLSAELLTTGRAALRVRFRDPRDLDDCTTDVRAGIAVLAEHGVTRTALVGHSFGAAVVIRAAAAEPRVATVITLAAQSHGADAAALLGTRPLLLVHGTADRVLPASCSAWIAEIASGPAELVLVDGAAHGFDADAEHVDELVRGWLDVHLPPGP